MHAGHQSLVLSPLRAFWPLWDKYLLLCQPKEAWGSPELLPASRGADTGTGWLSFLTLLAFTAFAVGETQISLLSHLLTDHLCLNVWFLPDLGQVSPLPPSEAHAQRLMMEILSVLGSLSCTLQSTPHFHSRNKRSDNSFNCTESTKEEIKPN